MHVLSNWIIQAFIIAVITSIILNSPLFIPFFQVRRVKRIDARVVGFAGTFVAFFLWCFLNPNMPAKDCALPAWVIIFGATLGPNYVIHKCRGNPDENGMVKTIQIKMTEKGAMLLEKRLAEQAPGDPDLSELFMVEQRGESPQERWEDAMIPLRLLGLLDEAVACIVQAWKKQPEPWLLTAAADAVEARQGVCTARNNVQSWYRIFWLQHAR